MRQWSWLLSRVVRQIWFRAAVISTLSVALAILAGVISPYLPHEFSADVGQRSVGTILEIMASSMLAVTTFSLTTMVSAYSSATQLATPRATQLMISDPTSQNALSTFLGAFIFSMVGIIGLNTGAYGQDGRIILFAATVVIILLVVGTLLRWIGHITAFGRMADVIDRVETAATKAMKAFADAPQLRARPAVRLPDDAAVVTGPKTGYVTHVDVPALGRLAERHGLTIHVAVLPGTMVHPTRPLMHLCGAFDDELRDALIDTISIERHRSFDQDPRLRLIALSEIASRALAPATNDPGTAIEVLNALLRVFLTLRSDPSDERDELPGCRSVHVHRPMIDDMLADAFGPILREGCTEVEVSQRLTATLSAMHANLPDARPQIERWAARHARQIPDKLTDPDDLTAFRETYDRLWPTA